MKTPRTSVTVFVVGLVVLGALAWGLTAPPSAAAQFISGTKVFWIDGDREDVFSRLSLSGCPAAAAPDDATWITVDSPTLNATNAKAAIIFAHAFAQQDGAGESNGVGVYLSKGGTTPTPDVTNQIAQSHVDLANEHGDEHSVMIIPLDANKDFSVYYKFGEVLSPSTDETQLCAWAVRVQLMGYIE